jgi:hypothetical protein
MGNRKVGLARLVVDSGTHERIQYLDENTLNLTRKNLVRGRGSSTNRARELIVKDFKNQFEIDHDVR